MLLHDLMVPLWGCLQKENIMKFILKSLKPWNPAMNLTSRLHRRRLLAAVIVSLPSWDLCPVQALSRMGGLWRKLHTVWVNVGGLHAGVFLLKRTANTFGQTPEDVYEARGADDAQEEEKKLS